MTIIIQRTKLVYSFFEVSTPWHRTSVDVVQNYCHVVLQGEVDEPLTESCVNIQCTWPRSQTLEASTWPRSQILGASTYHTKSLGMRLSCTQPADRTHGRSRAKQQWLVYEACTIFVILVVNSNLFVISWSCTLTQSYMLLTNEIRTPPTKNSNEDPSVYIL